MNDLACQKLCEIVGQYGPGVCDEPRKLRALLVDLCPGMPRQVNTLVAAAEQQVVSELRGSAATMPWSILSGRLVRRLIEETGMAGPDAQWVVDTWGKALGRAEGMSAPPFAPNQEPQLSEPDRPRSGLWKGLLVGIILLGVGAFGSWLVFRQRGPEPAGDSPAPNKPRTEPGIVNKKVRPALLDCTGENGMSAAEMRKAQKAWADYLGRPVEEAVELDKGVKMTFVLVSPGKFRMGSPENEKGREPDETLHEVTLQEPFYLGKYEVTQAQYEALTDKNPSGFKGEDLPVEAVTWKMAQAYGEQLTKLRDDKQVYRLPTEAEWEYACRGGRPSSQPFGIGDGHSLSSLQANFRGTEPYGGADNGPELRKTCAVGSYKANALGLFDMHGNVSEMCASWYEPHAAGGVTNPSGRPEGRYRVKRGGCWAYVGFGCRAASRGRVESWDRSTDIGFRLARSVPSPTE